MKINESRAKAAKKYKATTKNDQSLPVSPNLLEQNAIVVLCMHRSGSSAISGLLHTAGYNAGKSLLPGDVFNQKGYFESRVIVDLNEKILKNLGYYWDDVRQMSIDWENLEDGPTFVDEMTAIISSEYSREEQITIKDPRLCRLLPLWEQAFDLLGITPLYIIVLRQPEDVAASLQRRNAMTIQKSALLYLTYLLDAELYSRGKPRLVVRYADLLAEPLTILAKIDTAIGIEFTKRDKDQLMCAANFIDNQLCLSKDLMEKSIMQNSEPMHLAKQLYEALSSLNENDDSFRFDSIRKNFELRLEILQPWLNEAAYGKELYREILFPGKASIEIANLYAHAAVYWRTESQDYNEAQKIVQPVTFGGITCLLKFSLPASSLPITNLRFNPVDRPAFCSISRISLENTLSEEIWSADLNGDMFSSCSDDMIILGKEVRQQAFHQIVAIRKNPYGTLIIPTEVIQTLTEGCTLYIEMRLEMLAQAVQPLAERLLRLRESKQCIENVNIHAESDSDRVRLNHAKSQLLGETEKFASPEENNIFIYGMISGIDDSALLQTNRLFDLTGFNTGNLVTSYSIMQILGGKIRSTNWNYPLTEITDKRTTAILVLANHLGDHIDMGDQAIIFSDLQINLVGIGLGAQAGTIQSDINLSLGTLNWIRAIEEHSPTEAPNIALRGEFSRRILEKYKLEKKTAVLGCASLFISPDKNLGITIEKRFWGTNSKRVAVTAGHQEWTHLSKIESSLAKIVSETKGSYICQSPLEMVQLGRAECHLLSEEARFNCRSYINPEMTNEEFIEWSNLHASSFFSASAWLEYIRRFDFVIGTRIQGVILGLQAGIPSLCIAHDSRTEELCQTMMVPYVKANTILDGITFNDIPRLFTFDGSMFDKNRATLAKGYVDFLSSNNINSANYMREFTASQSVLSNVS